MNHWYLRLLTLLRPYWRRFLLGILCGVLFAAANGALIGAIRMASEYLLPQSAVVESREVPAWVPKGFVDSFVQWKDRVDGVKNAIHDKFLGALPQGEKDLTPGRALIISLLIPVAMILINVFGYLNTYLLSWVGIRVVVDLRDRLFRHILGLSVAFYHESSTGDLMSRINNDTANIQKIVTEVVADLVKQPLTLVAMLAAAFLINPGLALLVLVFFPLCIVPISIYGRKVRKDSRETQKYVGSLNNHLHESFTGVRVVKAFGQEEVETSRFRRTADSLIRYTMRIVRSSSIVGPMIQVMGAFGVSFIFLYMYYSSMPLKDMMPFLGAVYLLYQPVKALSKIHLHLQSAAASAERVFDILDAPYTVTDKPGATIAKSLEREIVLEGVVFAYGQKQVLKGVDLCIPKGSMVALVGRSGSGKTTIGNLLMRFYDPTGGRIMIDGSDLRDFTQHSWRATVGLVAQESILFNESVLYNIRYGKPDATMEEVVASARLAHAHDFILQLPLGYDSVVGEKGMQLSGGQRQRLAIARALIRNPALLILDEATSALDTESERAVQSALDEASRGRTVVAIAHRLSTIRHADVIVVLEEGNILEKGTHQELLAKGGHYAKLWSEQAE